MTGQTVQRIVGAFILALALSALVVILNWTHSKQNQSSSLDLTAKAEQSANNEATGEQEHTDGQSKLVLNANQMNDIEKDRPDRSEHREHKTISSEDLAGTGNDGHSQRPDNEQRKQSKQFVQKQIADLDNKSRQKQDQQPNKTAAKWAVQLATFANSANAEQLVHKLKQQGWDAYKVERGQYTLVYVGPLSDKNQARQYKKTLKNKLQLAGVVKPYQQ